ncbi:UDP-2,3-diacylglucosamine diphosphatase [Pelomicrobium methylotrophicum]|uniref:UDP-2,3-diacylglucosamine hydrolase n=1 Tax=Pelomicrobium methylotrophicum TaxID=2602750 RepID=A0A5C7EN88_9PROT|nr:UDP-2,3-diacylglucosamine diphosphatase [Pelomicrobium methylotrophicum]TXF12774.1 UDP-2,3-diacylglucosamine diphosphatase [Pelomicrobium methylotrophicum]
MPSTLFISDLHLAEERPRTAERFFRFLREEARQGCSLYILGDLFEYWIGDDDMDDPFNARVTAALAELNRAGVEILFLHGNRDFLVGSRWAEAVGARLIADPTLVELYGIPTLLMHGDTLCLDDKPYQAFRAQVRNPAYQRQFLDKPLAERRALARQLRTNSEKAKSGKTEAIMDVTPAAVEEVLRRYGYPRLIHGHTHRPARHVHELDGRRCERWVLTDWYDDRGGYLCVDESGCRPIPL